MTLDMPTVYPGGVEWVVRAPAWLNQAAPVQNTWYTVLAATGRYTKMELVVFGVMAAGETLGMEIVCDGVTSLVTKAAVAGAAYQVRYSQEASQGDRYTWQGAAVTVQPAIVEGHDLRVRIRKTTANGAGNLKCKVIYSVM